MSSEKLHRSSQGHQWEEESDGGGMGCCDLGVGTANTRSPGLEGQQVVQLAWNMGGVTREAGTDPGGGRRGQARGGSD